MPEFPLPPFLLKEDMYTVKSSVGSTLLVSEVVAYEPIPLSYSSFCTMLKDCPAYNRIPSGPLPRFGRF